MNAAMKELNLNKLAKIAGGAEDPMAILKRLVNTAKRVGTPFENTLRNILFALEGDLPASEIEAYIRAAYGM